MFPPLVLTGWASDLLWPTPERVRSQSLRLWASGGLEQPGALFWNPARETNRGQPIGKGAPHPSTRSEERR